MADAIAFASSGLERAISASPRQAESRPDLPVGSVQIMRIGGDIEPRCCTAAQMAVRDSPRCADGFANSSQVVVSVGSDTPTVLATAKNCAAPLVSLTRRLRLNRKSRLPVSAAQSIQNTVVPHALLRGSAPMLEGRTATITLITQQRHELYAHAAVVRPRRTPRCQCVHP